MTEKWRKYEALMIFAPEVGNEGAEELVQRAREFVTGQNGRVLRANRWGWRDLAFELKGRTKGYYLLLEFAGLPQVAAELDRRLNLIDSVLKFQTIKREDQVDPASLPEEVVEEPPVIEAAPEEAATDEVDETAADSEKAEAADKEPDDADEPADEDKPDDADEPADEDEEKSKDD
jgi:small subunit ribosomal protein S6